MCESCSEFVQFGLTGISVTFAIKIPDVSMTRKIGISFPKGNLVFFSPSKRLSEKDHVFLVYRKEKNLLSTVFRYVKEYKKRKVHLVPLNSRYRKEIILPRRMIESIWKPVAHLEIID